MTNLHPCPFCGSRLERSAALSNRSASIFLHPPSDDARCIAESLAVWDRDAERIEAWNRRAPAAALAAAALRLADAADHYGVANLDTDDLPPHAEELQNATLAVRDILADAS